MWVYISFEQQVEHFWSEPPRSSPDDPPTCICFFDTLFDMPFKTEMTVNKYSKIPLLIHIVQLYSASEKWFHDLSSQDKFSRQCRTNFLNASGQNIYAYAHEKTNNEYLPAYNTVRKVLPSLWAHVGRRSCLPEPSAGDLHQHRPAANSWGLRLWLPPCTLISTHKSYTQQAWKLSAQSHYRTIQHSQNAHYTSCQLYRHYTANKCVSQMGTQNKNSYSLQSEIP